MTQYDQHRKGLRLLVASAVALAVVLLFLLAYHEQELWQVASDDGSKTELVAQQRWFGLAGIDLMVREHDRAGGLRRLLAAGRYSSWSDAKQEANDLHRRYYGCDSPLHFRETIRPILEGIAASTELVTYEGVPRSYWPPQLAQREMAGRPLGLHDFLFFKSPVEIEADDQARLTALCTAAKTFRPYRAAMSSSAFCPDWCLLWKGPRGECRVVLCFACREARLYGPQEGIRSELDDAALRQFVAALQPYLAE